MKVRFRTAGIIGFAVASVILSVVSLGSLGACSNMSEGGRCNFDNGNDDCQSPELICLPATNQGGRGAGLGTVNPPYNNSDRCCPVDRSTATHPACTLPTSPVADAAPTGDAGPAIDSGVDATVDAADAADDASDASDAAEGG
jgi:hypothetical protein